MDQPGKVANPVRSQLNRENVFFLSPFLPINLASQERFGSVILRMNLVLTRGIPPDFRVLSISAASSIYLFKPPYATGSVPSLSGQAIACRWSSLPSVCLHRTSSPQGSSSHGGAFASPWTN